MANATIPNGITYARIMFFLIKTSSIYGFRAYAITPSNAPTGKAISKLKMILNKYGFIYL